MNQDNLFYARMTGAYGSVYIGGTNAVTGEFSRIECVNATVFATLTNTLDTTATTDVAASAYITWTGAPTANQNIVVNGVTYTFKAVADVDPDEAHIAIGATVSETAAYVAAKLADHALLAVTAALGVATFTARTAGAGGNSLLLTAGNCSNCSITTAGDSGKLGGGITRERMASATTYPANHTLHGHFTAIKLTSGKVIAYHANRQ